MGVRTLLPHLAPVRTLGQILKVRALRQIEQDKIDDALATLRLGYEMSDKVGKEPCLVSGLVSLSITSMMNDCLERLMNRPDAPNLYWALCEYPNRRAILSSSVDGECQDWENAAPNLSEAWHGDDLSAQRWRSLFDYLSDSVSSFGDSLHTSGSEMVTKAGPDLMRQAQEQYAQSHQITPEQAAAVDPAIVIGTFYLAQYKIARDEIFKLRGMAYPLQLEMSDKYGQEIARLTHQQPGNLFLQLLPWFHKAFWDFARTDRRLAALTAVEAIRSYAAANNGELPAQLSDIKDTPVPPNPATGEPFEYRVDNGTATLSDSKSEGRLTYTIRIRK